MLKSSALKLLEFDFDTITKTSIQTCESANLPNKSTWPLKFNDFPPNYMICNKQIHNKQVQFIKFTVNIFKC